MEHLIYPNAASAQSDSPLHSAPRSKSELPAGSNAQVRNRSGRRVLLVEEDQERRSAYKARLTQAGFKVTVALDDVSMAWGLQHCQYAVSYTHLTLPTTPYV